MANGTTRLTAAQAEPMFMQAARDLVALAYKDCHPDWTMSACQSLAYGTIHGLSAQEPMTRLREMGAALGGGK